MCSVLPRYPELRFIMPHLGGATSSLKGRMMAFFETADADIPADMRGYLKTQAEQKKFGLTERFEKLFQSLYFDSAGTGAWLPAMAAALNITSADRIMFGSDYPLECKTAANIVESLDMIRQAPCSASDKTAILGKTAAGLFNLKQDFLTLVFCDCESSIKRFFRTRWSLRLITRLLWQSPYKHPLVRGNCESTDLGRRTPDMDP